MLPPVYATLAGDTSILDLLGDPPRISRHGRAPQDSARPYVTWGLVVATPENTLSETPAMDRCTVQVDCWSMDSAEVVELAKAVRDLIEPVAHMTSVPVDEREAATKLYHMAMQFDWFLGR
jgi:hypothetical protein